MDSSWKDAWNENELYDRMGKRKKKRKDKKDGKFSWRVSEQQSGMISRRDKTACREEKSVTVEKMSIRNINNKFFIAIPCL